MIRQSVSPEDWETVEASPGEAEKVGMVQLNHFSVTQKAAPSKHHTEGLIPKGLCLIAGYPGSAKTILAQYLSWATAYEQDFLGLKTQAGPALYINNDHPEELHRRWLERLCIGAGITHNPKYPLVTVHHQWLRLGKSTDQQQEVEQVLAALKPVLLVIDRISTTLGVDEDRAANVEPFGQLLRSWADNHSLTIITIHHFIKEPTHFDLQWMEMTFLNRLRGSGAILGMADSAIELATTEMEGERLKEFGVRPHTKRVVVLPPFRVGLLESGDSIGFELKKGWHPVDREVEQVANLALPLFDAGQELTVKQVDSIFAGAFDIKLVREALKYLEAKGLLKFTRAGKGGTLFYKRKS